MVGVFLIFPVFKEILKSLEEFLDLPEYVNMIMVMDND